MNLPRQMYFGTTEKRIWRLSHGLRRTSSPWCTRAAPPAGRRGRCSPTPTFWPAEPCEMNNKYVTKTIFIIIIYTITLLHCTRIFDFESESIHMHLLIPSPRFEHQERSRPKNAFVAQMVKFPALRPGKPKRPMTATPGHRQGHFQGRGVRCKG